MFFKFTGGCSEGSSPQKPTFHVCDWYHVFLLHVFPSARKCIDVCGLTSAEFLPKKVSHTHFQSTMHQATETLPGVTVQPPWVNNFLKKYYYYYKRLCLLVGAKAPKSSPSWSRNIGRGTEVCHRGPLANTDCNNHMHVHVWWHIMAWQGQNLETKQWTLWSTVTRECFEIGLC